MITPAGPLCLPIVCRVQDHLARPACPLPVSSQTQFLLDRSSNHFQVLFGCRFKDDQPFTRRTNHSQMLFGCRSMDQQPDLRSHAAHSAGNSSASNTAGSTPAQPDAASLLATWLLMHCVRTGAPLLLPAPCPLSLDTHQPRTRLPTNTRAPLETFKHSYGSDTWWDAAEQRSGRTDEHLSPQVRPELWSVRPRLWPAPCRRKERRKALMAHFISERAAHGTVPPTLVYALTTKLVDELSLLMASEGFKVGRDCCETSVSDHCANRSWP